MIIGILLLCLTASATDDRFNNDYSIKFYPNYPPLVGKSMTVRVRPYYPAQKVTLYTDRELEIPLVYREGYWWGKLTIPDDYQEGWHFFTIWTRRIGFQWTQLIPIWNHSVVWYKAERERQVTGQKSQVISDKGKEELIKEPVISFDDISAEVAPVVTGEAMTVTVASLETLPVLIKGTKTIAFSSQSIEGSKEGYVAGETREESLRLNISGKKDETEIEANLLSVSSAGLSQVGQRDDKISVRLRQGSTEAFLGDFSADLTENEFARLEKQLSGVRLKGDYGRYGFVALYSSPKGEARFKRLYGDGTQGPYHLDAAPVVIDSERVLVDGVIQLRGDDYNIDYNAGTITFTKKTIDAKSILTINYDYRQNLYDHATQGVRGYFAPAPNLKLAATYLDDSDSSAGAAEIFSTITGEAVYPQGHSLVGIDGSYVSEQLTAGGEVALSRQNLNLLASGSEESGLAGKLDLSGQLGPLGVTAKIKRVGTNFRPIAIPDPKQAVTEYDGSVSFRPNSLFGVAGEYGYNKYTQDGVLYENSAKSARAGLTPERLPSLEYLWSENNESNDPVSGSTIDRRITRNSAETNWRLGFLSAAAKGSKEEWLVSSPSNEVTDYRRVNFGLATYGLEKVTLTSNVELEDRNEPNGATPYRKTYNLNLSLSPAKQFFLSTSLQSIDDSAQGGTNVVDLSYKYEPNEYVRTDGKYTVQSIKEEYATTEAVAKQSGSFSLDLKPIRPIRLRYLYKPNFTQISRNSAISFNNEQQQVELNLIPWSEAVAGWLYKQGRAFDISKLDAPNYQIRNSTTDTDSNLYTLKMAPLSFLSVEFNYGLDNGRTTQLVSAEPLAYTPGQSFTRKFDAVVRSSLTEKIALDSRYTYLRGTQGTGEVGDNVANSISHTGALKGTWNLSDPWSFYLSGAFTKTTNLLAVEPVSYTITPGGGFVFRQGELLRVDFDYTYAKSYAGVVNEVTTYALRAKYSLNEFINFTLRARREIGVTPDYKLTEVSGNLEIDL